MKLLLLYFFDSHQVLFNQAIPVVLQVAFYPDGASLTLVTAPRSAYINCG